MSIMACQMALYPLDTIDSSKVIAEVLEEMDWQGVEVTVGSMSTYIGGEEEAVWGKIRQLYSLAERSGLFSLQITVSNKCGCRR